MPKRTESLEMSLSRDDIQEAVAFWLSSKASFDLIVDASDIYFRDEEDGMKAADGYVYMLQTKTT